MWPEQMLQRARLHDAALGDMMEANLRDAFAKVIYVVTDYSGFGSPEIALSNIGACIGMPSDKIRFWRACDILPGRRQMLRYGSSTPMHIFGNILKQRLNKQTFQILQNINEQAKHDFKMFMGMGV